MDENDDVLCWVAQYFNSKFYVEYVEEFLYIRKDGYNDMLVWLCSFDEFKEKWMMFISRAAQFEEVNEVYAIHDGRPGDEHKLDQEFIKAHLNRHFFWACPVHEMWYRFQDVLYEDDSLGEYVRSSLADSLIENLSTLAVGEGDEYENLVARALRLALAPVVRRVRFQVSTLNKRKRRDVVFGLARSRLTQHFFYAGLTANNIILEAKNKKAVEGSDITQLAGYLGRAQLASVGLFVTRNPLSKDLRSQAIDARRDRGGEILILPIDDSIVCQMLKNVRVGSFVENEQRIIELFEQVLADVH